MKRGESLVAATKRELFEEAGLRGKVKKEERPLCHLARSTDAEPILYFLVKITDMAASWPEKRFRRRVFTPPDRMKGLPLGDAPRALLRQLRRISRLNGTIVEDKVGVSMESSRPESGSGNGSVVSRRRVR